MTHKIQCKCGALSGEVANTSSTLRVVCYCKDCQAYARHLGQPGSILDARGGTDIVSTPANNLTLTSGRQNLGCLSLTEHGLLRWYAKCCDTPIANTTRDWTFPYVGLVHTCLRADSKTLESSFSKARLHVNTDNAENAPQSSLWGKAKALLGFVPKVLFVKLSGKYRNTPFFSLSGTPVADVAVVARAESARLNPGG